MLYRRPWTWIWPARVVPEPGRTVATIPPDVAVIKQEQDDEIGEND